jgi:hypothetical protein
MSNPNEPSRAPRRKRPWLRRTLIAGQILLGLGLGLAATEYVFARRDEGAFPHVNFYVADAQLGVRLEPGATMRFRLRDNPLTTIHVNAQGYRGADWPAPTPDAAAGQGEIVVLGDSQVFGLGVEDDETFSHLLAEATGRTVLNAGVPTYGPPEYMLLARELLEQRKPQTLVVVLNFLNDPFELERPNVERHAVWDGWAVRSETAPEQVTAFPGRKWLFSQSHAVYALRRWWHAWQEEGSEAIDEGVAPLDLGTPSEGALRPLVGGAEAQRRELDARGEAALAALAHQRERLSAVERALVEKRDVLDELLLTTHAGELDDFSLELARGRPGDIVNEKYAEEARSVELSAALLRRASRMRQMHLDELLVAEAERKGSAPGSPTLASDIVAQSETLANERRQLRDALALGVVSEQPESLFEPWVGELAALCEQQGTELIVVALPFDVQVDAAEWDKYGVEGRPDMSSSLILLDDLTASAAKLHIRSLDATSALRGAQPGAFLDHDIHMTAKGHAALADALAATLATRLPPRRPAPGIPTTMSFVPVDADWDARNEVVVKGSTKAGCATQVEGGWFKLVCKRRGSRRFTSIEVTEGAAPATMAMRTGDGVSLVTPLVVGQPITARIAGPKKSYALEIRWPRGEAGQPTFAGELVDLPAESVEPTEPSAALTKLCECHRSVYRQSVCEFAGNAGFDDADWYQGEYWAHGCEPSCGELWGDPALTSACEQAHPNDCAGLLACVQHDPLFAPPCGAGSVHAFASNACFALCDDANPCSTGTCTPWQGSGVCLQ